MAEVYQWIFTWALNRYRKASGHYEYRQYSANLTVHGLLRYLERFKDMNPGELKAEIVTEDVKQKIRQVGGEGEFESNGIHYIVKSGKILTVYPHDYTKPVIAGLDENSSVTRRWSF